MKTKKKDAGGDTLSLIIVVLAIALTGGAAWYIFRKPKAPGQNDQPQKKVGTTAAAAPAPAPTGTGSANPTTWKEVSNTHFKSNPFAYVDGTKVTSRLNLRDRPGQDGNIVGTRNPGEYIGRHTGMSTDINWPTSPGRWAKITLANGNTAWVFSGYIISEPRMRTLNGLDGCGCGNGLNGICRSGKLTFADGKQGACSWNQGLMGIESAFTLA